MPRLRLTTVLRGRGRDRVMLVLKLAAIVVLTGVGVGFFIAAANSGGGENGAEVTVPTGPPTYYPGATGPAYSTPPAPTTTTTTTTIAVPTAGSQTAAITPKPTPTARPAPAPPVDEAPIARLNHRCAPAGAYAVASNGFEPLVCRNGRWARLL